MAIKTQYEIPAWNQIYDMLLHQTQKIRNQGYKFDVIVGIANGGVIPARILSDLLETPNLTFMQIEFYTGIGLAKNEPTIKQSITPSISQKNVLLVDDIADSGKTLKLAKTYLQDLNVNLTKTATLYFKPKSITLPDFYEQQTDNWVIFPWDTKETLRKIIQKQLGKRTLHQEVAKIVKAGLPKQLAEKILADM